MHRRGKPDDTTGGRAAREPGLFMRAAVVRPSGFAVGQASRLSLPAASSAGPEPVEGRWASPEPVAPAPPLAST